MSEFSLDYEIQFEDFVVLSKELIGNVLREEILTFSGKEYIRWSTVNANDASPQQEGKEDSVKDTTNSHEV